MDIVKSIQIFQQVVEDQSFTRAAENLNLVPSAVSRQVGELEKWLGVRLVNRTTRSLHLTDDGRRYLEKMAEISSQIEALKALNEDTSHLSGKVKITAPMMVGQFIVPDLLSEFKARHPDISLSLTLMNRKVDLIEEGFDVAIRAGNLSDSSFFARKIGDIVFKTVASSDYLKNSPPLNEPRDVCEHNCIISNSKRWSYKVSNKIKAIKVSGDIESNESACILSFARAGLGLAMLPEIYVREDLASGRLIEVLSDFASEPLPLNIIYPSNRLQSPTIRALIDYLVTSFESAPIGDRVVNN
ncbi:LysR family transcriptional regulator [Vibrio fluvialis]|uniref:LysR family transcriptional regulator n=1 Tax=Vibrio fluvialis TaxID=676 RepID=UPI0013031750|nr:LysR family transcriptional regulator [Vibrio fluvialis]EKO3988612.1 LysR family transcriptional regulator [Vibrio fluvialis]